MSSNFQVQKDFIARMQEKKSGHYISEIKVGEKSQSQLKKIWIGEFSIGFWQIFGLSYFWVFIKEFIISYIKIKLIFVFHKMAANLVKSFDLFCL